MAHHVEPMDVDCMDNDFDNKENTYHHTNVLPCTEKGYEELDVSELNMKLRYSMTPASSPMSKSFTAYVDNRNLDTDDLLNGSIENANLTRSLNSTMTKNDSVIKSLKSLPLQALPTGQFIDGNGNPSALRQLDATITENANITVTVSGVNDIDENLSLPSSSSSALHTPATTPTKDLAKNDGGSPIMRGLKSVLNIFRSSQSPIPPAESESSSVKQEVLSPADLSTRENEKSQAVASTPIAAHRRKEGNTSKRSSPLKDSINFNDDLETELNWKDETTILFSQEKIPVHKLFFQQTKLTSERKPTEVLEKDVQTSVIEDNMNSTVEYMDISYNESVIKDRTVTELQTDDNKNDVSVAVESDGEFVDCETTFTKNESEIVDYAEPVEKSNLLPTFDVQKLDSIKDISVANDNILTVNDGVLSNITGISFTEGDFKNDLTVPSDYSDYSKETTDILLELEKLNDDVSSKIESLDTSIQNNRSHEEKVILDQEIATNCATEEDKPGQELKTITCEENKLNVTEPNQIKNSPIESRNVYIDAPKVEENGNVTHNIDSKVLDTLESIVATEQYNAKIDISQDLSHINQNSNEPQVKSDIFIDSNLQVNSSDEKDLGDLLVQEEKTENENTITTQLSQLPIEETGNVQASETLNGVQSEFLSETLNASQDEKLSDIPLPTEEISKEALEIQLSDDSNAIHSNIVAETTSVAQIENPSDIPLPDEDDIDKEILIDEILPTIAAETANGSSFVLDGTTILPRLDVKHEGISDSNVEVDKKDIVLTEILHNTLEREAVHIPVIVGAETQISNVQAPEEHINNSSVALLDTKFPNDIVLPELSNVSVIQEKSLEIVPSLSNTLDLTTDVVKPDAVEKTKNNSVEIPPENNIAENKSDVALPKEVPISDPTALDQTYDCTATDITQIINDTECATNTLDVTVTMDTVEETQGRTTPQETQQDVEPMDITMNESLNQNSGLPDLVNQTITKIKDNVVITPSTGDFLKEELVLNSGSIEIDADKETTLEKKAVNIENKNTESDKISILESENLSNITQQNGVSLKQEYESFITELPVTNESKPSFDVENIKADDATIDCKVVLSDTQSIETPVNVDTIIKTKVDNTVVISVDEEIIVSGNNSPYVSLMAGVETAPDKAEDILEEVDNSFPATSNVASSPPITSKGYNFNFDEIEDPFATQTKIRQSPSLDTPTKPTEPKIETKMPIEVSKPIFGNRRKSQPPERKKTVAMKKKLNSTLDANSNKRDLNKLDPKVQDLKDETISNVDIVCEILQQPQALKVEEPVIESIGLCTQIFQEKVDTAKEIDDSPPKLDETINDVDQNLVKALEISEENKASIDSITSSSIETKTTISSSEQSTYYSAGGSSTDSVKIKNVFNLPEIDDINFNPFATKSKMRRSPTPDVEIENPFATRTKIKDSPNSSMIVSSQIDLNSTVIHKDITAQPLEKIDIKDKMETEPMEKEGSPNNTNTSLSKTVDNQNLSTREVNTEDEDTEEGPFLEAEDVDKMLDYDDGNVDMMQFNDLPTQVTEENMENGELFIDAEAFEFLLNQNNSNVVADSGKESLFLKFDPLFAKRISSDGFLAALSKVQKKQSTPTKAARPSLKSEASPIPGPATLNVTYDGENNATQESHEDLNITVSKPMMVVTPAVNPAVTPRNKSTTPTRSNRRSFTFTSPAIAVIDRLLSMSANNSLVGPDTTMTQPYREQNEADLALTQLRELLAEKEINVHNLRSESKQLKDRLATMESQVRILEADGQERLKKINELNERLAEKTRINKSMAAVVEEYERTIASLIAETEQDKKRNAEERIRLINERDEQTAHLASMEVSFSDLHSKYEKSKQVILACKANEDTYKKSIKDFEANLTKMQTNYELLKQHATSKLNHANQELEKINRAHEAEVVKLNAMIKRKDLHITSLEETLTQKTKANEELTAICDELINKVG